MCAQRRMSTVLIESSKLVLNLQVLSRKLKKEGGGREGETGKGKKIGNKATPCQFEGVPYRLSGERARKREGGREHWIIS